MKKVQIFFDEPSHIYSDNEGNVYTSATQLIGQYTPEYPAEFWAAYRALDQYGHRLRPDPDNGRIYVGHYTGAPADWGNEEFKPYTIEQIVNGAVPMNWTKEQIMAEWQDITDKACEIGNEKHNYLEDCVNKFYGAKKEASDWNPDKYHDKLGFKVKIASIKELENSPLKVSHPDIYQLLAKFINDGWILYAEKRVYSYEHKISGMIDILAVKHGAFYIIDWKTNKDELKFRSGYYKKEWRTDTYGNRIEKVKTDKWVSTKELMLRPLRMPHSKGNVYKLQLSLYAYLCELWGMTHKGNILVHIRHNDGVELKPTIYYPKTMTYYKKEMAKLFKWHKARIEGKASNYRGAVAS